jgi:hypothetical protein
MIKLKHLIGENVADTIKQKLDPLYKQYREQLELLYGPDGVETRAAAQLVIRLGNQGSFGSPQTATSPEIDKINAERKGLMKRMGELGTQINDLYQQLEDVGQGSLVKQMRAYQAKETEKFVLGLAQEAEQKSIEDSKGNINKLKADQQKAIDDLEKLMIAKRDRYRTEYGKWLQGSQSTPPPLPPTVSNLTQ